ncbi:MAG: YicC family protein [Planctomycetes bacterium]|nr:YicC family protein [Planctomycetota bacterium]
MKSMTGYGEARGRIAPNRLNIRVEVRSVNNRFLNLKMNLPELLSGYESDIEEIARQYLKRGAINLFIKVFSDRTPRLIINRAIIKHYHQELKLLQKTLGLKDDIPLNTLINLPGVLEPVVKTDYITNKEWSYIVKVIRQALGNLVKMRQREGDRLAKTLQKDLNRMGDSLNKIEKFVPSIRADYEASFRKRLQDVLDKYTLNKDFSGHSNPDNGAKPKNRNNDLSSLERNIAVEVALFAQKSDINEEIKRLSSHITEFTATLKQNNEVGKKLDFITQEMLREINTIGSKSANTTITYAVISLKSELEKIKEQVQNIE